MSRNHSPRHDRRFQRFGLHDACGLSLRFTVIGEANVAAEAASILNLSTAQVGHPIAAIPAAIQIMTMGGLDAVTRALAIEYAKDGIRVNTVAVGVIDTALHKPETQPDLSSEAALLNGLQPVGRFGEVKEIVDTVLFLTDATLHHR